MKIQLHFAPGACSFVPHVALEVVKSATGQDFEPLLVKLHKQENRTPEFLALNADGQVPVLVVDERPLTQIVAICEWLDRAFPKAGLLPADPWAHAQALRQLAWMNNTAHPTFTRVFRPGAFAESEGAQAEVKKGAMAQFRGCLERVQQWVSGARQFWHGDKPGPHDAYAFTLLRWGGYAGIDPKSLPGYHAYVERVMAAAPVAAVLQRERIGLDTYKPAAA